MTIELNSEFTKAIQDNHNREIVEYLNSKGFTLEQVLLEISKEVSLQNKISLDAAKCVVMYDAGFTLDVISHCTFDKKEIEFKILAQLMDNDELDYQLDEITWE